MMRRLSKQTANRQHCSLKTINQELSFFKEEKKNKTKNGGYILITPASSCRLWRVAAVIRMVHLGKSEAVAQKQAALMKGKSHYPRAASDFITQTRAHVGAQQKRVHTRWIWMSPPSRKLCQSLRRRRDESERHSSNLRTCWYYFHTRAGLRATESTRLNVLLNLGTFIPASKQQR